MVSDVKGRTITFTMDDKKMDEKNQEGCKCWMCQAKAGVCGCHGGHWGGWGFRLLRLFLLLALVAFVFVLGVKAGELKSEFRGYRGFRHHGFRGGYQMMGGRGGMLPKNIPQPVMPQSTPQNK
jgi:hypothetical protein